MVTNELFHQCERGQRRELRDARGVFCCYICDECEERKRYQYRAEVLTDPNYDADEPIEEC